jgi:N-ethylmaleimide reductase
MDKEVNKILLNPIKLGDLNLRNRFVMAPLTRMRAANNLGIPNEMHVKYYSERAKETGFVITECAAPTQNGNSFPGACGIWSKEQVEGWKKVCKAVHDEGGIIFLQMFHPLW